jgi:hypothetical protein
VVTQVPLFVLYAGHIAVAIAQSFCISDCFVIYSRMLSPHHCPATADFSNTVALCCPVTMFILFQALLLVKLSGGLVNASKLILLRRFLPFILIELLFSSVLALLAFLPAH